MSISRGMDKDVVPIYNEILLSHKKKKIVPVVATWMGLGMIILREVNQTWKDKYHLISLMCGI